MNCPPSRPPDRYFQSRDGNSPGAASLLLFGVLSLTLILSWLLPYLEFRMRGDIIRVTIVRTTERNYLLSNLFLFSLSCSVCSATFVVLAYRAARSRQAVSLAKAESEKRLLDHQSKIEDQVSAIKRHLTAQHLAEIAALRSKIVHDLRNRLSSPMTLPVVLEPMLNRPNFTDKDKLLLRKYIKLTNDALESIEFMLSELISVGRRRSGEANVPAAVSLNMTALIIDDQPFVREALSLILSGHGIRADEAGSGEEGVELLASGKLKPDIVFIDQRLGRGMGGLAVAETIRGMGTWKIVHCSGSVSSAPIPADDFCLPKPFGPNEVSGLVARLYRSTLSAAAESR